MSPAQDALWAGALTGLVVGDRPILINAARRFAALNPAELSANQRILGSGKVVPFVRDFQDFCHVSAAVQYRFTRERSLPDECGQHSQSRRRAAGARIAGDPGAFSPLRDLSLRA